MKKEEEIKHTENELIEIYQKKCGNSIHASYFIDSYNNCFDEVKEDDGFLFEGEIKKEAVLNYTIEFYLNKFINQLNIGHCAKWAHLVADNNDNIGNSIYDAFVELKKEQPQLAQQELNIHCQHLNEDEDFKRQYLYLFATGDGLNNPFKKATIYAKEYKKEIGKGKSKLCAHIYAELMADENDPPIYCEEYTYAFEKAFTEGKSIKYARVFAYQYTSELTNIKRRGGRLDYEEAIDFTIEKVSALMKSPEEFSEHKLKGKERFFEIYDQVYLNTYYVDNGMPKGTVEEIDKDILEKTLLRYNKL